MPTKRRRYKKSSYQMAKKALSISKKLASSQEKKRYDLSQNGFVNLINTPNLPIILNANIPQGTQDNQRIGDRIKMIGLRHHIHLFMNATDDSGCVCRFILMYDKEDTITAASDFLVQTGTTNVVNSPYRVDDRHRYQILYDKRVELNIGGKRFKALNLSKKLNKFVQYEAGTTAISKGSLKFFYMSNVSPAALAVPHIQNGWSRVWYTDS